MSQDVSTTFTANGVMIPAQISTGTVPSVNTAALSTPTTAVTSTSGYETTTTNKYSGQGSTGDTTSEQASQAAAAAGLPYVAPTVVTQIYNQTQNDPAMQQLQQQMLFFAQLGATGGATGQASGNGGANGGAGGANGGAGGANGGSGGPSPWGPANFAGNSPLAYNSPIPQLSSAARAAVNATGQNIWALVVVALKGALEDQNETLQYDLNKLQMYGKMSDQMSQYATLLDQTQTKLDDAVAAQTDDNKKAGTSVEMPTQLSFGPSSMFTLDANGNMLAQTISNQENSKNNANPVTSTGLNNKLSIFQQQRDQLQKNIDHWTNQYQSDNEVKNQLTTTITSILKNMYDMQSAVTRNLNL